VATPLLFDVVYVTSAVKSGDFSAINSPHLRKSARFNNK